VIRLGADARTPTLGAVSAEQPAPRSAVAGGGCLYVAAPPDPPRSTPRPGPRQGVCFCRILASGEPDESTLVVWRDDFVAVALQRSIPYASGQRAGECPCGMRRNRKS